jgi:carbamoyltransferase
LYTQRIRQRTKKQLNIVGISSGYHDSACCIMQDGVLIAAAQEERFSRVKNDKTLPRRAFRYCLEQAKVTIAEIDCVAYYEDPTLKLGRQLWMALAPETPAGRRGAILNRVLKPRPELLIKKSLGYDGPVQTMDHHLSHAASAYYFSGFTDAAIFTVDGVGDWASTTYGYGRGAHIERLEQVDFPHSLGFFYSAITGYLGFEVNEGEYKVMGLAPYGKPKYVNEINKLITVGPEGQYSLNLKYFDFMRRDCMFSEELIALLGQPPRPPESELGEFYIDVARSAQVVLEEVLLEKVKYLHSRVPSENLCMAGGVALNVVANSRCLNEGPFKRLFVQPAAGDAGGAVGAAAVAHVSLTGESPQQKELAHVYLGPDNSSSDLYRVLKGSSAHYRDFRGDEEGLIRYTVDRLAEGKVVGWCQGRMEFGPRSLGARSILADPRDPQMRDRINALVKKREAFRPFAPAVLESKAREHFDLDHPSPFMLEVCQVVSSIDCPAITHVDGSARIQTVDKETNPRFHALLEGFQLRTGCPILLNTSFNMRGEPIVCSAIDAINSFVRCGIDVLVVEDFILERTGIPPLWELQAQGAPARNEAAEVSHRIYTMF